MFPEILRNGFWHTTNEARFAKILETGFLLPEPPIPDSGRWGTSEGPSFYPYVRKICGISLFDFTNFDQSVYDRKYPLSNLGCDCTLLYQMAGRNLDQI